MNVALIIGALGALRDQNGRLLIALILGFPLPVWVGFCVIAKRLHDRDMSAWYYLLVFIPAAQFWLLIIECGAMQGSPGANSYGKPPGAGAGAGARYNPAEEPDNSADIDAMIARAKTTLLAPQARHVTQMAMAHAAGPPVFGKRR